MENAEDNVYARLQQAQKMIASSAITKDGTVSGGSGYRYVTIAQILAVVRRAHAEAGITVVFGPLKYDHESHESRREESRESENPVTGGRYKTAWIHAYGHVDVRIYGRDADDVLETTVTFEAKDNSDKLANKCYTNAERTLYRTLYAMDEGEGDDPESVNVVNDVKDVVREEPVKPAEDKPVKPHHYSNIKLDRPRDVKEQMIAHALADPAIRKRVLPYVRKNGGRLSQWTDTEIDMATLAVLEGRQ